MGIVIDNQLIFDRHEICVKANNKLSVLTRVIKNLDLQKRRIRVKAFCESQFKYCSLVYMLHTRQLNKIINRLHERALRLIYDDYNETFEKLLERNRFFTTHENNIQQFAIEMFKVKHCLVSEVFENMFVMNNNSTQLHSKSDFYKIKINTEYLERIQ